MLIIIFGPKPDTQCQVWNKSTVRNFLTLYLFLLNAGLILPNVSQTFKFVVNFFKMLV